MRKSSENAGKFKVNHEKKFVWKTAKSTLHQTFPTIRRNIFSGTAVAKLITLIELKRKLLKQAGKKTPL